MPLQLTFSDQNRTTVPYIVSYIDDVYVSGAPHRAMRFEFDAGAVSLASLDTLLSVPENVATLLCENTGMGIVNGYEGYIHKWYCEQQDGRILAKLCTAPPEPEVPELDIVTDPPPNTNAELETRVEALETDMDALITGLEGIV